MTKREHSVHLHGHGLILWQAIPARKRHHLDAYHLHYAVKYAVKCRKTAYFTPSCAKKRRFLRRNLSLSRARVKYARFEHQNARKIRRSSSMLIISALLFSQPMHLKCLRPIADQDKQTKSVQHRSALRISPLIWRLSCSVI